MKKTLTVMLMVLLSAMLIVSCSNSSKKVYTVTFDSNGGSEVTAVEVKEGETVAKPTDPTKNGYVFDKWTSDEAGETEYDFDSKVTADITLYAQWGDYYKVGDKGPAGGTIFYVNPNYEEGSTDSSKSWKYLEAGASDLVDNGHTSDIGPWEFKWGPNETTDCNTKDGVGDGLENTRKLSAMGSDYEAAYAVYGKELYGYNTEYTDWFIPSKEELRLLVQNTALLKKDQNYWSSSEAYGYSTGEATDEAYALKSDDIGYAVITPARDSLCYVRPVRRFN